VGQGGVSFQLAKNLANIFQFAKDLANMASWKLTPRQVGVTAMVDDASVKHSTASDDELDDLLEEISQRLGRSRAAGSQRRVAC
jgi:hypothetical protein